jgi:hypothetical protein
MSKVENVFESGLQYLIEVQKIHILSTTALEVLSYSDELREKLMQTMVAQVDWSAPGSLHRQRPEQLGGVIEGAGDVVMDGFTRLNAQTLVAYWSGLEALVEDIFVAWLQEHPEQLNSDQFSKVKVKLAEFMSLNQEEQLRLLLQNLEINLSGKQGVSRFEALLDTIGLSGSVDEEIRVHLYELNHIRHVIVHRASVPDRKFLQAMNELPRGLRLKEGEKTLRITEPAFRAYQGVVFRYAQTLKSRVLRHEANNTVSQLYT